MFHLVWTYPNGQRFYLHDLGDDWYGWESKPEGSMRFVSEGTASEWLGAMIEEGRFKINSRIKAEKVA